MSGDTPRSFTLTDGSTLFGIHGVNQASKQGHAVEKSGEKSHLMHKEMQQDTFFRNVTNAFPSINLYPQKSLLPPLSSSELWMFPKSRKLSCLCYGLCDLSCIL